MTFRELLKEGTEILSAAGIDDAEYDAAELLYAAAGLTREEYLLRKGEETAAEAEKSFREMAGRRAEHIPLQHILGFAWFFGYRFSVGPEVLIPRYDTEVLVDKVLRETSGKGLKVLDLCTGSGIIGCVLALEGEYSSVTASDISGEALRTASRNAAALGAPVKFLKSDLFGAIPEKFDVIVSNPPYIRPEEIENLSPEVRDHDPRLALDGGSDGLLFYRRIAREGRAHLTKKGRIFFEIGDEQAEAVSGILRGEGYGNIEVVRDLAGLDRVVSAVITD